MHGRWLVLPIMIACFTPAWPWRYPRASADVATNLAPILIDKLGALKVLRDRARSVTSGLAAGVREQAEELIDREINPMIERISVIIDQKIEKAYQDALDVLLKAEQAMDRLIEHAHDATLDIVKQTMKDLDQLVDKTLDRIDDALRDAICSLAPHNRGVYIENMPFSARPDKIVVASPAASACWPTLRTIDEPAIDIIKDRPCFATFSGISYYLGMMCEREHEISRIDVHQAGATERIQHAYEELAGLASAAICSTPKLERTDLFFREQAYERNAIFYRDLAVGTSKLIQDW